MKIIKEMPQNGAFVMVWEWDGELHSDSFKYINDVLHVWDYEDQDCGIQEWIVADLDCYCRILDYDEIDVKYIVID